MYKFLFAFLFGLLFSSTAWAHDKVFSNHNGYQRHHRHDHQRYDRPVNFRPALPRPVIKFRQVNYGRPVYNRPVYNNRCGNYKPRYYSYGNGNYFRPQCRLSKRWHNDCSY